MNRSAFHDDFGHEMRFFVAEIFPKPRLLRISWRLAAISRQVYGAIDFTKL